MGSLLSGFKSYWHNVRSIKVIWNQYLVATDFRLILHDHNTFFCVQTEIIRTGYTVYENITVCLKKDFAPTYYKINWSTKKPDIDRNMASSKPILPKYSIMLFTLLCLSSSRYWITMFQMVECKQCKQK